MKAARIVEGLELVFLGRLFYEKNGRPRIPNGRQRVTSAARIRRGGARGAVQPGVEALLDFRTEPRLDQMDTGHLRGSSAAAKASPGGAWDVRRSRGVFRGNCRRRCVSG